MTWISVDTQLPEDGQKITFKGHFDANFIGSEFEIDGFFKKTDDGHKFMRKSKAGGLYQYEYFYVTHWRA
jgi:hypothetical protein